MLLTISQCLGLIITPEVGGLAPWLLNKNGRFSAAVLRGDLRDALGAPVLGLLPLRVADAGGGTHLVAGARRFV